MEEIKEEAKCIHSEKSIIEDIMPIEGIDPYKNKPSFEIIDPYKDKYQIHSNLNKEIDEDQDDLENSVSK